MKSLFIKVLLSIGFLTTPFFANAQMFSVDDEPERSVNPFAPYIRVGIIPINFSYTGDPAALKNNASLNFTGTVAHANFETGGFNLGISFGDDITGLNQQKYFDLNLKFFNPFYFVRKKSFGLGVPIQLGTKVTSVRSDRTSDEFNQTNLHAGAGAIARLIIPNKMDMRFQFIPSFGFSTASGGLIGGNVFSMRGLARFNFYNVIFGKNLSLGYDYIYDSYNIDGEKFDYDYSGHAITLGISL